ncbi:hypothetical protein [Kribbella sp. NPDC051770]|uniref:hypothetical protein n=1 Tax=Kribbella sp. NPDC051770 TaxID=3155413 RepID=UPI0034222F54
MLADDDNRASIERFVTEVMRVRRVGYRSVQALERRSRSMAESKSAPDSGEEWSDDEVRRLMELAEMNTPTEAIGAELGRTEDAVRSKAQAVGVFVPPSNRPPYDDAFE